MAGIIREKKKKNKARCKPDPRHSPLAQEASAMKGGPVRPRGPREYSYAYVQAERDEPSLRHQSPPATTPSRLRSNLTTDVSVS